MLGTYREYHTSISSDKIDEHKNWHSNKIDIRSLIFYFTYNTETLVLFIDINLIILLFHVK